MKKITVFILVLISFKIFGMDDKVLIDYENISSIIKNEMSSINKHTNELKKLVQEVKKIFSNISQSLIELNLNDAKIVALKINANILQIAKNIQEYEGMLKYECSKWGHELTKQRLILILKTVNKEFNDDIEQFRKLNYNWAKFGRDFNKKINNKIGQKFANESYKLKSNYYDLRKFLIIYNSRRATNIGLIKAILICLVGLFVIPDENYLYSLDKSQALVIILISFTLISLLVSWAHSEAYQSSNVNQVNEFIKNIKNNFKDLLEPLNEELAALEYLEDIKDLKNDTRLVINNNK